MEHTYDYAGNGVKSRFNVTMPVDMKDVSPNDVSESIMSVDFPKNGIMIIRCKVPFMSSKKNGKHFSMEWKNYNPHNVCGSYTYPIKIMEFSPYRELTVTRTFDNPKIQMMDDVYDKECNAIFLITFSSFSIQRQ